MPRLQQHLLAHIISNLQSSDNIIPDAEQQRYNPNNVLFKNDHIYRHNLLCINYTAYDIRRCQDVVNASTSHHNIMLLADPSDNNGIDSASNHTFKYARVLGVYHANVLYVARDMVDYQPRRMEFLWVRWYENTGLTCNAWENGQLDRIKFPSMAKNNSFGFVDPSDVLRSCQIIPHFREGKCHTDGKGLSRCAQDSEDYVQYYVNR